jgi:hypothetical protein
MERNGKNRPRVMHHRQLVHPLDPPLDIRHPPRARLLRSEASGDPTLTARPMVRTWRCGMEPRDQGSYSYLFSILMSRRLHSSIWWRVVVNPPHDSLRVGDSHLASQPARSSLQLSVFRWFLPTAAAGGALVSSLVFSLRGTSEDQRTSQLPLGSWSRLLLPLCFLPPVKKETCGRSSKDSSCCPGFFACSSSVT